MPDYSEPTFPSGGVPDELAPAYRDSRRNSYSAAHAEADDELDVLRNLVATAELSPAEFRALVREECPGRRWKVEAWSYLYSDDYPAAMNASRYHATVYAGPADGRGVPLAAESLRDLARLIREAHEHMARVTVAALVPALELAAV